VIDQLDEFADDATIYVGDRALLAQRGERLDDAPAVVATEGEDGEPPGEAAGLRYFLEVRLAKEAIGVWRHWRDDAMPTLDERSPRSRTTRSMTAICRWTDYGSASSGGIGGRLPRRVT
jgi:hypothetical protein